MGNKQKTLLVGLDAACWEYIDPLLQEGHLPTLQRLMSAGVWGTLHSTIPPWTPTAWSSIITGKGPGKHGVFDMVSRQPGSYSSVPTNANTRLGTPFWKRLNDHGIRVGLVNVPFTYPPEPIDGFLVCGFGTPGSVHDFAYPNEVIDWIYDKYPEFEPIVDPQVLIHGAPEEVFIAEKELQNAQVAIAAENAERYDVDVLVINLMFLDHANHKMPQMEQVQQAICQSDKDLQKLIESFSPDNVMVISDHGANRVKGNFLLQAWLRDNDYFVHVERKIEDRDKALNWILLQWLQTSLGYSGSIEKGIRRLARAIIPRLPKPAAKIFWDYIDRIIPYASEHIQWTNQPDYSNTPVFTGSIHSGYLYVNLQGREAEGFIQLERKDDLLNEIVAKLTQIIDPDTGSPLFTKIYHSKDIYAGPSIDLAPDLILDRSNSSWNIQVNGYNAVPGQAHDQYFIIGQDGQDYGWHSKDGILVFSGENLVAGQADQEGSVFDVPAILLYMYGVPIPEDFDGCVLNSLFKPDYINRHPITFQPGDEVNRNINQSQFTEEEEKELYDHLRALGYL